MSRFRMGPAPQPYQRRTAKNVMDASSLPVSSWSVTVVSCLTRASTAGAVGGFTDGRGTERQQVIGLVPGGELPGLEDELGQLVLPGVGDVAVAVEVLHEGERPLVRGEGHRARAGVGIHQQEVDSVGPDIEDA